MAGERGTIKNDLKRKEAHKLVLLKRTKGRDPAKKKKNQTTQKPKKKTKNPTNHFSDRKRA